MEKLVILSFMTPIDLLHNLHFYLYRRSPQHICRGISVNEQENQIIKADFFIKTKLREFSQNMEKLEGVFAKIFCFIFSSLLSISNFFLSCFGSFGCVPHINTTVSIFFTVNTTMTSCGGQNLVS